MSMWSLALTKACDSILLIHDFLYITIELEGVMLN